MFQNEGNIIAFLVLLSAYMQLIQVIDHHKVTFSCASTTDNDKRNPELQIHREQYFQYILFSILSCHYFSIFRAQGI